MEKNTEEVKLRVPPALLMGLAKLANVEDRSLSEYCRPVLSLHVFGHAHKLDQVAGPCEGTNGPCQGPRNC